MNHNFAARLAKNAPVLLDGATGTELHRRGVDLNHPSWTARIIRDDPRILQDIHRDYAVAGADIITANTFRTHARNLAPLGLSNQAREMTCLAVEIARQATRGMDHVLVAGSVAPLEDCYSPQLTPNTDQLANEHGTMAENLHAAGVDLILIETQVTIREAITASRAARATGLPFLVSFVCDRHGNVLSGESLAAAFEALAPWQPAGFLVNCLPVEEVLPALEPIRSLSTSIPRGAYANTGRLMPDGSWELTSGKLPAVYAGYAKCWMESGLKIIGGCCGTTPEHITQVHNVIYGNESVA